jgi:hypothetical protein
MSCHCRFCFVGAIAVVVIGGSLAFAQNTPEKPAKPTRPTTPAQAEGQHDHKLPPGITEEEFHAWMEAATPGPMHARLRESVGVWEGTTTSWMKPGMEPTKGTCTSTITPMMNGQYTKCEVEGMSEFGPFQGFGIYGYDNVAQEFQSTWIDSHGTGIVHGTGELSSDGDTITWVSTYNCPLTKKPMKMRQVETRSGPDAMTLAFFGPDLKTGKEYKMMEIAFRRTAGSGDAHASASPGMISDKKAEAGCGLCSYHMPGAQSCVLAVKIDGKPYLVTQGANLVNVHQFCGTKGPKPAVVTGTIVDGKFQAKEIELKSATR